MSIRRTIVEVDLTGLNVTEFCRQHGISTWLFYQLRRRYAAEGEGGLEPRSRAAKTIHNRTPEAVEEAIIALRKELEAGGWDAGPASIANDLPSRLPEATTLPSEATIWRVLTRRGFVTPEPQKAPQHAYRRFVAERANELWQIDDTNWSLADGTPVKIIALLDDCTRVGSLLAAPTCDTAWAFEAFTRAAGHGGGRPGSSPTTPSPSAMGWPRPWGRWGSRQGTPVPTTPRPVARWSASIRP